MFQGAHWKHLPIPKLPWSSTLEIDQCLQRKEHLVQSELISVRQNVLVQHHLVPNSVLMVSILMVLLQIEQGIHFAPCSRFHFA